METSISELVVFADEISVEEIHGQAGENMPQSVVLEQCIRIACRFSVSAKAPNDVSDNITPNAIPQMWIWITNKCLTGFEMEHHCDADKHYTKNEYLHDWNTNRKSDTSDEWQSNHPNQAVLSEIFCFLNNPCSDVQRPHVVSCNLVEAQLLRIGEILNQNMIVVGGVSIQHGSEEEHREKDRHKQFVTPLELATQIVVHWKRNEEQHAGPIHARSPICIGPVHGKTANSNVHRADRKQCWIKAAFKHRVGRCFLF